MAEQAYTDKWDAVKKRQQERAGTALQKLDRATYPRIDKKDIAKVAHSLDEA